MLPILLSADLLAAANDRVEYGLASSAESPLCMSSTPSVSIMRMRLHLTVLVCMGSLIFATLTCVAAQTVADIRLVNDVTEATFSTATGSLTSFRLHNFSSAIPILSDYTTITLDDSLILACPTVISTLTSPASVTFTYQCPASQPFQLTSVYTLLPAWAFLRKETFLFNTTSLSSPVQVSLVQQSLSFESSRVQETGVFHNSNWQPHKDHAIFIRTAIGAGSPGLFAAFQSPFVEFTYSAPGAAGDVLSVNATYPVGLPVLNVYGEAFNTDGFILGGYLLSPHWHVNAPSPATLSIAGISFSDRSDSLNYAERASFTACVERFWVGPPRTSSIRLAVAWDSNDYQCDISTAHGVEQYRRLIDRSSELGLSHMVFAPQNSAVSSRLNTTDSWGWEEALWLTLGEHLRQGPWVVDRDPIPPSIQSLLDYAASRRIKLMAYVYPPLGYRAPGDSAWLYGDGCCSSLAVPQFQRWLAGTLIAFAKQTGLGGFAFDYNGYQDGSHTTYAQWKGWHWVLRQLRDHLPDAVMDHRQICHAEGPWSWLTGSYAEPLQGDENPGQSRHSSAG